MTHLDTLILSLESPHQHFLRFKLDYKKNSDSLHLFFEGTEDQSFYMGYIRTFYGNQKDYTYLCNGKDNVYFNYRNIDWSNYKRGRVLFFTDKDFDDLIPVSHEVDSNIFVTSVYSIENYLVSSPVLTRFMKEVCLLNLSEVIDSTITKFEAGLQKLYSTLICSSALLIAMRRSGIRYDLSNIDMSDIFALDKNLNLSSKSPALTTRYFIQKLNILTFPKNDVKSILEEFATLASTKSYIRGKFEIWYLCEFAIRFSKDLVPEINKKITAHNKANGSSISKCSCKLDIRHENILQVLGPRVAIPTELSTFIQQNFQSL